jgi:hypothetical protein
MTSKPTPTGADECDTLEIVRGEEDVTDEILGGMYSGFGQGTSSGRGMMFCVGTMHALMA